MPLRIRLLLLYLKYFTKTVYGKITPEELRKIHDKEEASSMDLIDFPPIKMFKIWEEAVSMRDGEAIKVRIFRPVEKADLPLIVFFHGGGFVTRTVSFYDRVCRRIASVNQSVVVSVDYRLAPEHKFPGPLMDCYDAMLWAVENAGVLGADASRLTVMGDSAGGNLATTVCLMAREERGPKIGHQVLIYPSTDARLCHPSIDQLREGYLLTKEMMIWFLNHYKSREEDIHDPYMSPLLAEDLSGLPPAFVLTAEYDPLKDEGKAYALKLREAGVPVRFKEYKGMIHGFFCMPRITKQAILAHEEISASLQF